MGGYIRDTIYVFGVWGMAMLIHGPDGCRKKVLSGSTLRMEERVWDTFIYITYLEIRRLDTLILAWC